MTIKEYIIEKETAIYTERLEKLETIGAPQIVITAQRNAIKELQTGNFKVGGDTNLLDYNFKNREVKTGRSGKTYISFDGKINYFPTAKYGRYIVTA